MEMILKSLAIPGGILFFYLIFYLMYVKGLIRKLDDQGWKKVDYWWIGIGTFALFIQFFQVNISLDTASVAMEESIARAINQNLNIAAADLSGPAICLPAKSTVRKERSLEQIKELDDACTYFTTIRPALRFSVSADNRVVDYLSKQSVPKFTSEEIQRKAQQLSIRYQAYVEQDRKVKEIDGALKQNKAIAEVTKYLAFMSLIVAVALRLIKVTGEIRVKDESSEAAKITARKLDDSISYLKEAVHSLQRASDKKELATDPKGAQLDVVKKKVDALEASFANRRTVLVLVIITTTIAAVLLARVL